MRESIQSEHLCALPVCCVKASSRAIFSALTAGQSSAASWVSIGHSSTVHYHMGVAKSSLHKKCFQLRSKEGTWSARHACTGSSPHCVTWGNFRVITKAVYQFKAESLQMEKVSVPALWNPAWNLLSYFNIYCRSLWLNSGHCLK